MTDIYIYVSRPFGHPLRFAFDPIPECPLAQMETYRVAIPPGWTWSGSGRARRLRGPGGRVEGPCRTLALARRNLRGFRLADPTAPVAEPGRRGAAADGWDSDAGIAPAGDTF